MASTPQHPGGPASRPEDKGFWEEYLKKVINEDIQLIARWQKALDTCSFMYVFASLPLLTVSIILR